MQTTDRKKQRVVKRLLTAVDRAIRACDEAKRARDELTRLTEAGRGD